MTTEKPDDEKICFVICPIGSPESETRDRSDKVLRHIIKPVVESMGYSAVRSDHMQMPGMITSQIVKYLIEVPLVIADLSERNPNVFYELAIRHAVQKPVIHLISTQERIPFDVANFRTIHYDYTDPDKLEACKIELLGHIENAEQNPSDIDNPIAGAFQLDQLRRSSNPIEMASAQLYRHIERFQFLVERMELRLGFTEKRAKQIDEIIMSSLNCREIIESGVEIGFDVEIVSALTRAFELQSMSIVSLLHEFGIVSGLKHKVDDLL